MPPVHMPYVDDTSQRHFGWAFTIAIEVVPSVHTYFGDAIVLDPDLNRMYDQVLPQIDRALAE